MSAIAANGRNGTWRRRLRQGLDALIQPQVSSAARERRDLLVLLIAVALVMVPHFDHLALWATALVSVLWFWRLFIVAARRPLPGRTAMLPLLGAAAGAVWLSYGTLLGREAGVTFLLLLLALKLLELRAKRDVFIVIFLCFFILLTQFLFGQGLLIAALTFVTVLLLFFVLVSVNLADDDLSAARKARLVLLIFAKSLPLAAVMFLLFPRMNGPLWGVPSDTAHGSTGLSNSMSPGTIGRLLDSNEVAFRVQFHGEVPRREALYWRGPVFGVFTGRTWLPLAGDGRVPFSANADPRSVVEYTVTLEPHHRDWLFALELPALRFELNDLSPRLLHDGQLVAGRLISERIRYPMRSYTRFALGLHETDASLRDWLTLPSGYNPRTLAFAAELQQRTRDPAELVDTVLAHFRSQGYRYTLEPPLLGRHTVDEFLFDTRLGYCEHYASAFVVLMRALGIPSRVVTGYQGGEINPVDGFLTVRQSDAHAWAEVWIARLGWVRVDPTAAVAPARIEQGAESQHRTGIAPLGIGTGPLSWIQSLRLNWEALENAWNQWVLSFSADRQRDLLSAFGFEPDMNTLALVFAVLLTAILIVLAAVSLRHRVLRDPYAAVMAAFRQRLTAAGLSAPPHEGPTAMLARLQRELAPESHAAAREFLLSFSRWRYSPDSARGGAGALRGLRAAVRRFKPRPA